MTIYLIQLAPDARDHRDVQFRRRSSRGATLPEAVAPKNFRSADRLPSLCFVLHRMGFFVPRELLRER